jgi:hypothetical protein
MLPHGIEQIQFCHQYTIFETTVAVIFLLLGVVYLGSLIDWNRKGNLAKIEVTVIILLSIGFFGFAKQFIK